MSEVRLIDANYLIAEFTDRARNARQWKEVSILNGNEDAAIRADAVLAFLIEVKLTIDNAPTITPGGRYNGKRAIALLSEIETIARDAFNDPETLDINLYRAQALARIFQLFEYNNEKEAEK